MRTRWSWVVVLAVAGCSPKLEVPDGAVISCATDADCPGDWLCHPALATCAEPGFDAGAQPRPEVVYVLPADGAQAVDPEAPIVMVFSQEVLAGSLASRVRVTPSVGEVVALLPSALDARTYELVPAVPLAYLTSYTLEVLPGVEAVASLPSVGTFESTFSTRPEPDRTAPESVSGIVIDVRADGEVALSWDNPGDDFAGVLVLRAESTTVDGAPTAQHSYEDSDVIGNAVVVARTTQGSALDAPAGPGPFAYAFFVYDAERNYSAVAHAPYVTGVELRWCPDESAHLAVFGPSQGTVAALVGTSVTTTNLHQATPSSSGPVADELHVPRAMFTLDVLNFVRPVVQTDAGTYIGAPIAQHAHPAALGIIGQPLSVGTSGESAFRVSAGPWTSFEAQVDEDPFPDTESFGGDVLEAGAPTVVARATMSTRGEFRFRVRPSAASCGSAAWTTSEPFDVGDWIYVSASAPPGGSGAGPTSPVNDLAAALETAVTGTELYVAAGDYFGAFEVERDLRLLGGWATDFSARDTDVYVTRLTYDGSAGDASTLSVPVGAETTLAALIDGLRVEKTGDGVAYSQPPLRLSETVTVRDTQVVAAWSDVQWSTIARINNGAAPLLDGVSLIGPVGATSGSTGLVCEQGCAATVRSSTVHGGRAEGSITAVLVQTAGSSLTLEGNTIIGGSAVDVAAVEVKGVFGHNGTHLALYDNEIHGTVSSATLDASVARGVETWSTALLVGNRIYAGAASHSSHGVRLHTAGRVELRNNIILGGDAPSSIGVIGGYLATTLVNNTIGATGPSADPFVQSSVAVSGCDGACSLVNNVLFTAGGTNRWGIGAGLGQRVAVIRNNLFAAVPHGLYTPAGANQDLGALHALDGSALNIPSGCSGETCDVADIRDNLFLSGFVGDVFVDWDGPDNDPQTFADNDYRLSTTDAVTLGGGLDLGAVETCGAASLVLECGPVSDDVDGIARTCVAPGACFTPGAHESDD